MANTKKQFMAMYDESVDLLKKFKQSNDNINKSIGLEHDSSVMLKIRADRTGHKVMTKKLDEILQKLEQSYLDPDTARKIGTVKQQYKIQKDRREHIIGSLDENSQTANKMRQETSEKDISKPYKPSNTKNQKPTTKRAHPSDQPHSTTSTSHTFPSQTSQQITQYDYEIECKLLQQKNKALTQTQKQIKNVYHITNQIHEMVQFQGEHIDIISDHIQKTRDNTSAALKEIKEANEYNKKRRKKIFTFSLVLIVAVILLLAFLLA